MIFKKLNKDWNFGEKTKFKKICNLITTEYLKVSDLKFTPVEIYGNIAKWEAPIDLHPIFKGCTVYIYFSDLNYYNLFIKFPCQKFDMRSNGYDGGTYRCDGDHFLCITGDNPWEDMYMEVS